MCKYETKTAKAQKTLLVITLYIPAVIIIANLWCNFMNEMKSTVNDLQMKTNVAQDLLLLFKTLAMLI